MNLGFIPDKVFQEKFKSLNTKNIFTNENMPCNPRFIEDINDFKRFFPELIDLESKKLKGSFVKSKKLGGIFNIGQYEFVLRIALNYEKKVMFQVGLLDNINANKQIANDIIKTFCFLFGNI